MAVNPCTDPFGRNACVDQIRTVLADIAQKSGRPIEVHVSTAPPTVNSPYTSVPHCCPHGVAYWIEPTRDQIAAWTRDGVE